MLGYSRICWDVLLFAGLCCFLKCFCLICAFRELADSKIRQNITKYDNGSKKEYKYIKSDPKLCPGGAKVPPKCSKWSSWGHFGGPGPSKWSPWGSLRGSKWGPWGLVGTLWGVMGVWGGPGYQKVSLFDLILSSF